MTDDKKTLPSEIPVPETMATKDQVESQNEGEVSEEQIERLISGDLSFQGFFSLSDEVLLAWANQGYTFYNEGKYGDAETIFKGLVTLNTKVAYYHTALGSIYEAQEKYEDALEEFNEAIKIDEKDICALVNRGEICLRRGKVLEAAEDFQKAIGLDEANVELAKSKKETIEPDPAAMRARALSMVTFEVLKEIEAKVKEAQENK